MTILTKPVRREVVAVGLPKGKGGQPRALIVTIAREGVYVREKGRRTTFGPLSFGSLYLRCAEVQAYAIRRERAEKRKNARKSK
jgi:hypothetical protein